MKGKKKKFVILGGLVVLVVAYLVYSGMRESMVYYYTVSEIKANASQLYGQGVRVSGEVLEGSILWDPKLPEAKFKISDSSDSEAFLEVIYKDVLPDAFREGREVILEGRYTPEGVFLATTLLTKCPSKYVPTL